MCYTLFHSISGIYHGNLISFLLYYGDMYKFCELCDWALLSFFFFNKCYYKIRLTNFCEESHFSIKKLNHRISCNHTENHKYSKRIPCSVIVGCGFDTEYLYKKYSIIICYSYNNYYCSTPIYKAFFCFLCLI